MHPLVHCRAALVVACALFAACGGGDDPSPAGDTDVDASDVATGDTSVDSDVEADTDDTEPDGTLDTGDVANDVTIAPDSDDVSDVDDTDVDRDADTSTADTDADVSDLLNCGGEGATTAGGPFITGALIGTHQLVYDAINDGGPWDNGELISADLMGDDTMVVDGVSMSGPVRRAGARASEAEAVWCAGGLEYALSDVRFGTFNEINVFDLSRTGDDGLSLFLGQLRPGGGDIDPSLVTMLAGEYAVTHVWAGTHTRGTLSIGTDGTVDFDDGVVVGVSTATSITDRLGCCTRVQANYEPSESNGWTTTINFHVEPAGDGFVLADVERRHNGSDGTGSGIDDVSVREPIALPEPTGTLPGETPNVVSATVGESVESVTNVSPSGLALQRFTIEGANDPEGLEPTLIRWTLRAPAAVGEWPCYNETEALSARVAWRNRGVPPYGESDSTGDCTVFVDAITVDGSTLVAVEGRFVAELRDSHRNLVAVVSDGVFRYTAP